MPKNSQTVETDRCLTRFKGKENDAMLITMLATAMTIAMLIATAFGFYEEAQRAKQDVRVARKNPFGNFRR